MPLYKTREGDGVYNAPYRATEASLNVFVISADPEALQALVDRELNACVAFPSLVGSQQGLRFTCADPWIVLIYSSFRSLGSVDEVDRRGGFLRAFELSIWTPIMKRQQTGNGTSSEPGWFLPLLYTSPTAAAVTGREVFGYPKVPAYLEGLADGGPPVGVRVNQPLPGGVGATVAQPSVQSYFSLTRPPLLSRPGSSGLPRQDSLLAAVIGRYIANLPLVFRKQVRLLNDAGQLRAGYTALVEARVPLSRLEDLKELDPASSRVNLLPPEVRSGLGILNEEPLAAVAVRQCTLDIQEGREIWVADGYAPYIPPLSAPGNALIDKAHAFDLASPVVAGTSGARTGSAYVRQISRGVAEVYFCHARPFAIMALLARHFPERLPGPKVDPRRNFVALMFLRAEKEDGVGLYEFGVWVPVVHQGTKAWYVPYLFRSPGAAVIHAREWFGHPCQEGFITFTDKAPNGGRSVRSVLTQRPVARGILGTEWMKRPTLTLQPCEPPKDRPSDGAAPGSSPTDLMLGEQQLVSLLQVRHVADTRQACIQEVTRSEVNLQAKIASEPLFCRATLLTRMRLGGLLDIEGPNEIVRGLRLDDLSLESKPPSFQAGMSR